MAPPRLPLNALRAFETTVRLGTMSAAASELGVTHGAVSRHIQALEVQFGVPLLRRLPKSVAPTPEGSSWRRASARHSNQCTSVCRGWPRVR